MESSGTRKNRPKIVKATYLKMFSRLRWLARMPPGRRARRAGQSAVRSAAAGFTAAIAPPAAAAGSTRS